MPPPNKGMKQRKREHNGASQLIPGVFGGQLEGDETEDWPATAAGGVARMSSDRRQFVRSLSLVLVVLTSASLGACDAGKVLGRSKAREDSGRFVVTGIRRTLPSRAAPEELVVRINTATGETWILAAVEKDGKITDRWARIPEPIKETRKLPSGKEYTIEEEVEVPH